MLLFWKVSPSRWQGDNGESTPKYALLGSAVGIISGLTGIGGGVILVPAMVVAMNFSMH
jgi:uncharacterized membrane protein YfcA